MIPSGVWPFLRIAHRGAAGLAPENTLRGIEVALRCGVEMVEIDTRPCKDGTLVVIHDATLERVAGMKLRVSDLTLAELQRVDVGEGERVPTLVEALALLKGRALVNIDQKVDDIAPALLDAIDRAGSRSETILSGGARRTFRAMRALAPEVPCALSLDARWRDAPRIALARWTAAGARGQAGRFIAGARCAGATALTLDYQLADARVVSRCKRAGLPVYTWTVDDLATMRRLRRAGVDGITSNRPDLLMRLG